MACDKDGRGIRFVVVFGAESSRRSSDSVLDEDVWGRFLDCESATINNDVRMDGRF